MGDQEDKGNEAIKGESDLYFPGKNRKGSSRTDGCSREIEVASVGALGPVKVLRRARCLI